MIKEEIEHEVKFPINDEKFKSTKITFKRINKKLNLIFALIAIKIIFDLFIYKNI